MLAALAFLTVGISLKLALFPLHVWLPNAYAYAPSMATIFLAATATKVAVYLLLRYFFSVFGASPSFITNCRFRKFSWSCRWPRCLARPSSPSSRKMQNGCLPIPPLPRSATSRSASQ